MQIGFSAPVDRFFTALELIKDVTLTRGRNRVAGIVLSRSAVQI